MTLQCPSKATCVASLKNGKFRYFTCLHPLLTFTAGPPAHRRPASARNGWITFPRSALTWAFQSLWKNPKSGRKVNMNNQRKVSLQSIVNRSASTFMHQYPVRAINLAASRPSGQKVPVQGTILGFVDRWLERPTGTRKTLLQSQAGLRCVFVLFD